MTEKPLGELCLDDGDCDEDSFCDAPSCGGPGACTHYLMCIGTVFEPACGCDGKTYANRDCANSVSVRVANDGECE